MSHFIVLVKHIGKGTKISRVVTNNIVAYCIQNICNYTCFDMFCKGRSMYIGGASRQIRGVPTKPFWIRVRVGLWFG